jgi:hypothetical protein
MFLKCAVATMAAIGVLTAQQRPAPQRSGGFIQPDPIDFNEHAGWQ